MEKEKVKYCFVILHYQGLNDTIECISSIQRSCRNNNYNIVIIDNASPNGTGKVLKERYQDDEKIYILLNARNLGFSKGNNLGFVYAKKTFHPSFIIILNNDTIVEQDDFCDIIYLIYKNEKFSVLGPDIIDLTGNHQNPHRNKLLSKKEINRIIRNRRLIKSYFILKKIFFVEEKVQIVEKVIKKWEIIQSYKKNIEYDKVEKKNVVLQGSCLIFSSQFIKANDQAFFPETFMYFEEDILMYRCKKMHYKTLFSPKIRIIHKTEASTKFEMTSFEKNCFVTENLLQSAKVLRDYIKEISR